MDMGQRLVQACASSSWCESAGNWLNAAPAQASNWVVQNAPLVGTWADKIPVLFNSGSEQGMVPGMSQEGNTAGPGGLDPNQFDPWKWGSSSYREGYEGYYNITRDSDNYAVHHVLPQRFENVLSSAGINVHDPRLLREVRRVDPVTGINWHQTYTTEWDAWANALGRTPTAKEIVNRAMTLETANSLSGTLNYRQGAGLPGAVNWEQVILTLK